MKIKNIIFIIIFFPLFSCEVDFSDNEIYYKIEDEDFNYIPIIYENIGNIITFKNLNSKEIRFKTNHFTINKSFSSCFFVGCSQEDYFYDRLWISLTLLDMEFENENDYRCKDIIIEIVKGKNEILQRIMLPISPRLYTENSCRTRIHQFRTPEISEYNITTMTIDDTAYNNVLIFEVGENDYYNLYNNANINKVYYDIKNGILGFDTSDNFQYRIIEN